MIKWNAIKLDWSTEWQEIVLFVNCVFVEFQWCGSGCCKIYEAARTSTHYFSASLHIYEWLNVVCASMRVVHDTFFDVSRPSVCADVGGSSILLLNYICRVHPIEFRMDFHVRSSVENILNSCFLCLCSDDCWPAAITWCTDTTTRQYTMK